MVERQTFNLKVVGSSPTLKFRDLSCKLIKNRVVSIKLC